jgi:hypothetical protein
MFPNCSYSFLENVTLSQDVLLLWEQEVACSNHAAPTSTERDYRTERD